MKIIAVNKNKGNENQNTKGITREEFEYRMDLLELKTEQLDRKLSKKADDIVSFQLLQHRHELEDIYHAIQNIDRQIKHIERELDKFSKPQKNTKAFKQDIYKDHLRLLHT